MHDILTRAGVLRPPSIQPEDLPEAIRLYEDGWSLARLAVRFDVSSSTVNRACARPARCGYEGSYAQPTPLVARLDKVNTDVLNDVVEDAAAARPAVGAMIPRWS